ncbi:MAG: hypothetical protein E7425_09150 [Ruminococcaceae bacterium]|jgi:hypothetical protein|nr:hypothetical protein [Oscillospiraceae bacterium]
MSASREKKVRQERGTDYVSPKEEKERKECAEVRRTTVIFTICAVLFVFGVAAMALWNSGTIQRGAAAVRVNGETFTAADFAYYYYNARANLLNSSAGSEVDTSKSLRLQDHTAGAGTWFDYVSNKAVQALTNAAAAAQAAKSAGFTADDKISEQLNEALSSLSDAATSYGYTTSQYLKAIYGPLMTTKVLERNLRMTALADAYVESISGADNFSDADLTAAYDADPDSFCTVHFESVAFLAADYMSSDASAESSTESGTSDTDSDVAAAAALGASQEAAAQASVRVKNGESAQAVADELGASYSDYKTYKDSSDLSTWLFDAARQEGDVTVLDYYGAGAQLVVFHGKERADFFPVNVRHILVEDEAKANELLEQFNAGDKSEASFAALAEENSTDTGSSSNGGLYENVYVGQMVKPFEDWCFDASRQVGDVGIVQTDYGYHVMYFSGRSDTPYWKTLAASKLATDSVNALTESATSERLNGIRFIDN